MEEHIIEFNTYYDKGFWYIEPKVNGRSRARLNIEFLTQESALQYIDDNRSELERRYMPRPRNNGSGNITSGSTNNSENIAGGSTNDSENENARIGGKIAIFAVGALAGALTTALILTSSCTGCKGKGTKDATNPDNAAIVFTTNTPLPTNDINTEVIVSPTPYVTVAPIEDSLSVEEIEKKANDIYNRYNEFKSETQVIVGDKLVTLKLSEKDIMNAIVCLNCDYLENEHYNTFLQLRSSRDADSVIDSYQDVITFIQQLNLQKYMATRSTKEFMSLSCLLLDDESRDMAEKFEDKFIEIMDANLGYDAWNTGNNKNASEKVSSLTDELIDSASSNNVGLTGIMAIDYNIVAQMCKDTMRTDQREVLLGLSDRYEDTNDNAIRRILIADSFVNNPECYNSKSLVRTKHC